MSLSRKRRKELTRLRKSADELWNNQQEVLERANAIAREASRQAGILTREEVAPRVRESYEHLVRPGVQATQDLAEGVRHQVVDRVLPGIGSGIGTAIGSVMSVGDIARDARVRSALNRIRFQKPVVVEKKGPGAGTYIALGVALAAVAGVAYAVWQTFRADDELWVAEDEPAVATSVED